jgi:tight adherence protein C
MEVNLMYAAVFIFFLAIFMLSYGVLHIMFKNTMSVKKRIQRIDQLENRSETVEEERSFAQRTLLPLYKGLSNFFLKATPGSKIPQINNRLERAGMAKKYTAEKWLFIKGMLILIISLFFGMLIRKSGANILKTATLVLLIAALVNAIMNFYLSKRITIRKENILRSLPYTLDLISVSVEAGLAFDGALARVVSNIKGDLSEEFAKSLKEIRMGIQRKEALRGLSERCDVKELSMFITSIVQADELGVSLSRILKIESANLREQIKQIAREKAMKAPVKMLFPLVFFIFPVIFVIILGPIVIKLMDVF